MALTIDSSAKVAVASSGLGHVARGNETWARELAAALQKQGVDVTLLKGGGQQDKSYEHVIHCAKRHSFFARNLDRIAPRFCWRLGLGSAYQIEQTTFALLSLPFLRRGKFDILHTQDPALAALWNKTERFHRAKVILAHGTNETMDFLDTLPCVQELSPSRFDQHAIMAGRRRFCIPNFVDTEKFTRHDKLECRAEYNISPDAFVVLSVGSVSHSVKRMDWLAKEFSLLKNPRAMLVIATAKEQHNTEFIKALQDQFSNRALVLEDVPYERISRLYATANVFTLCSLHETFGLAFAEAMACGIPCIGHCHPTIKWVIGDGGECVDMEESSVLANALTRFQEKAVQLSYGQAARNRAVSAFSREAVIPQIQAMYSAILNE